MVCVRAWGACCVCGVRVACVGCVLFACGMWGTFYLPVVLVRGMNVLLPYIACCVHVKRILAPTLQEAMRLKNEYLTIILIVEKILIWFKAGRNIVGCYSKGQLFMII